MNLFIQKIVQCYRSFSFSLFRQLPEGWGEAFSLWRGAGGGFLCLFLTACGTGVNDPLDSPLVSVGDEQLTHGELQAYIPANLATEDSAAIADEFVNRWVRNKLFLRQAEQNLTPGEKDVSLLLDEYRTSLLVHQYQEKMLEQKYSPLITSREVEGYYHEMQENFKLQENILKGAFLKVPRSAPDLSKVRRWMRGFTTENIVEMEAYAFQNARLFDQFLDYYVPFQRINGNLPVPLKNEARFLQYNKFYETGDDENLYFIAITDYHTAGSIAPLDYVEERIKAILLNKKRGAFIKNLEKELYEEALQEKIINFY